MTDGQMRYFGRMDANLTADVNNWAPTGIGTSGLIYINPTGGTWSITGILAEAAAGDGNAVGRVLKLVNKSTTLAVILPGLSGSSSAANQFARTAILPPAGSVSIHYDRAALLWRIESESAPFIDSSAIQCGSSDTTKGVRFECDTNVPTGVTVALSVPASNGVIATLNLAETLTNKTLTTPTIASMTNAQHTHADAAGGGKIPSTSVQTWYMSVTFQAFTNADINDQDQPTAAQFFRNSPRHIIIAPLAPFSEVMLCANRHLDAAATNSVMKLKYRTSYSETLGDYSDIRNTGSCEIDLTAENTVATSGWVTMASGAKVDPCYLALETSGGDGVLDPKFGTITAYFRTT
jgi:hypothetical protein